MRLDLPVVTAGMTLSVGDVFRIQDSSSVSPATQPSSQPAVTAPSPTGEIVSGFAITPYGTRILRGTVEGPLVEQLTGQPRTTSDEGSYLSPLPAAPGSADGHTFVVKEPMPLYVHVTIPATAEPGEYRIPVTITPPGKTAETAVLTVEVADIALPTQPRVLATATTTVAELTRIYPASFGEITGQYLDRGAPDHKAAVEQLDKLVKTAREQGVALFVEDIVPTTRVDEMGQVTLDWDAYDRLMQPYMSGWAFEDRVPLPVWLAPVPPRRIRDSSTQLWQFIDQCAKHFAAKGWVATPAFLHPALAGDEAKAVPAAELEKQRTQVAEMMRLHMPREMLAVMAPPRSGLDVPHGQLWVVNDRDARLPPAGALGRQYSVRAWPWVCVARGNTNGGSPTGVKGLVWRQAVARREDLKSSTTGDAEAKGENKPLLVVDGNAVEPTLRMVWLNEGLNDAALLGLLEKRTDANRTGVLGEILGVMAGRTGTGGGGGAAVGGGVPAGAEGVLIAGWAGEKGAWGRVTPMLQKLVLASDPGTRATVKLDDPLYLAAKLWLGQARRPVARITGFGFSLRPGPRGIGSDILDARLGLVLENPIGATAEMELRFANLPGDFEMTPVAGATAPGEPAPRRQAVTLGAAGVAGLTLPLAGHVESLMASPRAETLEITERYAGAVLPLPVQLPIYRMHALEEDQAAPKLDGNAEDWPMDNQTKVFGEMKVGLRYLSRADLLNGTLRGADLGGATGSTGATAPDRSASVRWTYDKDYLYVLARCPEEVVSDERNTQWPVQKVGEGGGTNGGTRWWGTDGLQIVLGPMAATNKPATMPGPATGAAAGAGGGGGAMPERSRGW